MKFPFYVFISILFLSCSHDRFKGFTEKSPSIFYQRIALGEGLVYHPDSTFLNYTLKFGFFDSINPIKFEKTKVIKFAQTTFEKPESEIMYGLTKGDQLNLIVLNNKDFFEKLTFETESNIGQNWFISIKVDEVVSTTFTDDKIADPNLIEYERIKKYLLYANGDKDFEFTEGIWINKTLISSHNDEPIREDIILDYKGYYLDGNIFDIPDYPLKFNRSDQNQVIPGISIALNYMHPGDSTMIIIPSHLAFGEAGSKDGNVPPNEPVVYGLKLLRPGEYIYPANK